MYCVIFTCMFLTISYDLSIFSCFTGLRQRTVAPVVDITFSISSNETRPLNGQILWSTLSVNHKLNAPVATSFRNFYELSFTRAQCLNRLTSEQLIDSPTRLIQHPLWTKHMITLNRQTKKIGGMVDLGCIEWAKTCHRLAWCNGSLTSVSMNILRWSGSQSYLFRFKSLISSSVGYTSVLYMGNRSSDAIIFAAVLTKYLLSSSPFSCLFWNETSFTTELATIFWYNSGTDNNSTSPYNHLQRISNLCLLCYCLVFLLLVLEFDFVVTQWWNCLCMIGGSVLQKQQSLSNLTKLKLCVVTVLPCPLFFLQVAAIKLRKILCRNICQSRFYPDVAHLLNKVARRRSNMTSSQIYHPSEYYATNEVANNERISGHCDWLKFKFVLPL